MVLLKGMTSCSGFSIDAGTTYEQMGMNEAGARKLLHAIGLNGSSSE